MSDNLTPKQEAFCLKYIETGNASEAYRQCYDASRMKSDVIHVKASELLADGKVAVRVNELKEEHRKRHAVTVESLARELDEARQMAIEDRQLSVMVSASMGKAKICGIGNDTTVVNVNNFTRDDKSLLDEYAKPSD